MKLNKFDTNNLNSASLKGKVSILESSIMSLNNEIKAHEIVILGLKNEKEDVTISLENRIKDVERDLDYEITKIEKDVKAFILNLDSKKKSIMNEIDSIKKTKNNLYNNLLAQQQRILELETQIGPDENYGVNNKY